MMAALSDFYPWIKALHIISVIAWMAGLLYMPRLFVYHAAAPVGSVLSETFKVMERRLLRGIILPATVASLIFGALLIATPGVVGGHHGWLDGKLTLVLLLLIFTHLLGRWRKAFEQDRNLHTQRFYRWINEVPTVLMVVIVILVVVKPF